MNETNLQKGFKLLKIGGAIYLITLILLLVLWGLDIQSITYFAFLLLLFLPGLKILYKEYSLKNRGLLLISVGIISYFLEFLRIIFVDNGRFSLYAGHNIIFLTLTLIIPAILYVYLDSFREDIVKIKKIFFVLKYYMSLVGITFIISLVLFGFGYPGEGYINSRFWINLGLAFLVAMLFTGAIFIRGQLFRNEMFGETLATTISTIVILIVIICSFILIYSQIFPLNLVPEP